MNSKHLCIASAVIVSLLGLNSEISFASSVEPAYLAAQESQVETKSIDGSSTQPASAIRADTTTFTPINNKTNSAPFTVSQPLTVEDKLIVPWDEMNLLFRESYANARRQKIDDLRPIVILKEGKIILLYKNKRDEFSIIPQRYTLLKSVSHITLAIFVILDGKTDAKLDETTIKTLKTFRESVEKAARNIDEWTLSPEQLSRQKQIIETSKTLMDTTLKNGTISSDTLLSYTRSMGRLVMENADDSIGFELGLIDTHLKKWKESIPSEDWKRLHVAVLQPHMPRNQNRIMQYFQMLLKQPHEGESIVYGEGRSEEDYAIDLIGTHILDRRVAVDFFKDPWRMHRDLLSDAAKRYLKKHHPLD